ncbi:MAG: TPM domain-containing protein [Bacillus sp. (in: firmicutes)]
MIKKAAFLLIAAAVILISFLPSSNYAEVREPVGDIYVQDFAGILSESQKAELIQLGRNLDDATTAQVAVLTVDSLDGQPIEEFSVEAFRQYGLGTEEDDNGVLLILSVGEGERHIRIEVGYGLEGAIPDGKAGRILDEYAIPYLQDEQPDEAVMETYKAIYNEVASEYNWDGHQVNAKGYNSQEEKGGGFSSIFILILAVIVIFLDMKFFGGTLTHLFLVMLSRGGRGGGDGGPRGGGGGSSGGGGAGRGW